MGALTVQLRDPAAVDLAVAGGKAAGLGELVRAGFSVPDGFVVTTAAYRLAVGALPGPLTLAGVSTAPVPDRVSRAIHQAYADLGAGLVAVRSSATAEDLPGAAFAGQQDSVLGVVGPEEVVAAVRTCWASLWGDRAVAYRERLGIVPETVAMAVVVQRMVDADFAGVMFTANPITGSREEVVIDSSPGLGEAVVSGLVTPDHAVIDGRGCIVERRPGRAEVVITLGTTGGTTQEPADPERPVPALDAVALTGLAATGREIAAHFARPVDVEWAIGRDGAAILQARPMTALPPPPRSLNRLQRSVGPVILELLPRRPRPMELTVWTLPAVGSVIEELVRGLFGARLRFADMLPSRDGVVTEFVPPSPRPTWRTPLHVWRTFARTTRNPAGWADDPLARRHDTESQALAALEPQRLTWRELVSIPPRAAATTSLLANIRVAYIPGAAAASSRLSLALRLLGLSRHFNDIIAGAPTGTRQANDQLLAIAELIRADPVLAEAWVSRDPDELVGFVATDPAARVVRTRLSSFLEQYGHRETSSVLLLDPTWGERPATVLGIISVLVREPAGGTRPDDASAAALAEVLAHPLVRRFHLAGRLRHLATVARAGVAAREDTHLAGSRQLTVVRKTVLEVGHRLARHGWLADPHDVWFLLWEDVADLPDPSVSDPDPELQQRARRRRRAYDELAASPLIATTTLYPDRARGAGDALVSGTPGGGGRASGAVRVIHGPDEFVTLAPGEVLVAPGTNPSWTPLFARASAVVVDHGGPGSHAAVVAREYGLPLVVGTATGTSVLTTGTPVVVDGDHGLVLPAADC